MLNFVPRSTDRPAFERPEGISPILYELLVQSGIRSREEAEKFLHPGLSHLYDPFLLPGIREAAEEISRTVKDGGRICVYGDYDVDGVCAVAGCAFISLMLYAAMSIGHSFNKGKKGLSVLFAFLFYHALQILGIFSIVAISRFNWDSVTMKMSDPAYMFSFAQGAMGVGFLVTAILCTVFYFVTHYFLSKRLNLE